MSQATVNRSAWRGLLTCYLAVDVVIAAALFIVSRLS
jgi:hypothetical protein